MDDRLHDFGLADCTLPLLQQKNGGWAAICPTVEAGKINITKNPLRDVACFSQSGKIPQKIS
jgi:hypothetical protein